MRHRARWVAGITLSALIATSIVVATRPSAQATQVASPLVGRPAPRVIGLDLTGRQIALSSYRGRYVLVNFFASWCGPCQQEEPDLSAFSFHQSRQTDGAALLSVVYDDSDSAARRFVAQWGQEWPAVADRGGAIANAYGVTDPPTSFLISPRGSVVGVYVGPASEAQLNQMVATARRAHG